jgi:hypothetical protein
MLTDVIDEHYCEYQFWMSFIKRLFIFHKCRTNFFGKYNVRCDEQ